MITKAEFIKRLKEAKFFEDPEEQTDYTFPVIEYFCANFNAQIIENGKVINLSQIPLIRPKDNYNFTLMNQAFESLRVRFEKGEL